MWIDILALDITGWIVHIWLSGYCLLVWPYVCICWLSFRSYWDSKEVWCSFYLIWIFDAIKLPNHLPWSPSGNLFGVDWLLVYSVAPTNGDDGVYDFWNIIFDDPFIGISTLLTSQNMPIICHHMKNLLERRKKRIRKHRGLNQTHVEKYNANFLS